MKAVDSEEAIDQTLESTRQGLAWVMDVEQLASQFGIMKGKLSRMLLPFNKDTDAKNQANVKSDLGSPDLDQFPNFPLDKRAQMVRQALAVRKFLRVKVFHFGDSFLPFF